MVGYTCTSKDEVDGSKNEVDGSKNEGKPIGCTCCKFDCESFNCLIVLGKIENLLAVTA